MVAPHPTLKKSANPRHALPFIQPASLLRFALLFVMVATPVLLSLLPSQGEANYFLSVQMGDHSYGLPAYCESVSATLSHCTPIGTLPLSSEASSLVSVTATALQGVGERLECAAKPNAPFYCHRL
jgi:hypothetical protein